MKNHALVMRLSIALTAVLLGGCATVTRGTKDTLVIETDPAGADVRLSTGQTGKSPTSFTLPRKEALVVTISRDGYETVNVNVNSQVAGAGAAGMAGNVLVGGIIGLGVDAISGATKSLKPNPVVVKLVKLEPAEKHNDVATGELTHKLEDLKAAFEKGLLNAAEYEQQRIQLLGGSAPRKAASEPQAPAAAPTLEPANPPTAPAATPPASTVAAAAPSS